jgi:hypothetical protein
LSFEAAVMGVADAGALDVLAEGLLRESAPPRARRLSLVDASRTQLLTELAEPAVHVGEAHEPAGNRFARHKRTTGRACTERAGAEAIADDARVGHAQGHDQRVLR